MGSDGEYGNAFQISATISTTETRYDWGTGIAHTGSEPNKIRVRKVTITNLDGSIVVSYRLTGADAEQFTLAAGASRSHEVVSPGLWLDAASGTPAVLAIGEG